MEIKSKDSEISLIDDELRSWFKNEPYETIINLDDFKRGDIQNLIDTLQYYHNNRKD